MPGSENSVPLSEKSKCKGPKLSVLEKQKGFLYS